MVLVAYAFRPKCSRIQANVQSLVVSLQGQILCACFICVCSLRRRTAGRLRRPSIQLKMDACRCGGGGRHQEGPREDAGVRESSDRAVPRRLLCQKRPQQAAAPHCADIAPEIEEDYVYVAHSCVSRCVFLLRSINEALSFRQRHRKWLLFPLLPRSICSLS